MRTVTNSRFGRRVALYRNRSPGGAMKTFARAVSLILLASSGSWIGISSATAQDAAQESSGAVLEQQFEFEKARVKALRDAVEDHEKYLKTALHPTLEEANRIVATLQGKVNGIQQNLNALDASSPKKPQLEVQLAEYLKQLDHFRFARTKLDPNAGVAVDLAIGKKLNETKLVQGEIETLNKIKDDLEEHEQKLLALTIRLAKIHPGTVPELRRMTFDAALTAIQAAKLIRGEPSFKDVKPETSKEWSQMIVVGQSPASGEELEAGKGVVTVTLAARPAPENPDETTANSSNAPADGQYVVTMDGKSLATMVWTNQPDGTATMQLRFSEITQRLLAGNRTAGKGETFKAVEDKQENAYIIGGADFQDFAERVLRAVLLGGQISDVQTNVRFVARTEGQNVILNLEGRVRVMGTRDGKPFTETYPNGNYKSAKLIGTPTK